MKALVFTLPHTLKIWIKHPKGTKTTEQIIEAHGKARQLAQEFSRKHGIKILEERESRFSEHTIEQKRLDNLVRPVVLEEPALAGEKLGISINQTSHKGKVEWTGRKAKDRVMAFEYMLDGGLARDLAEIKDTLGQIVEYSKKPGPPD
jgi:hypothetical protein